MALPPRDLGIGEVARRTGLSVSALRFYEAQGLVRPIRASGGQRRYLRSDIRRLSVVMVATDLGFTLAEIRAEFEKLPERRAPGKADWTRLATHFRAELERRIAGLTLLRDRLDGCIGCGCLSLKSCQMFNPEDSAATEGPGPRRLLDAG